MAFPGTTQLALICLALFLGIIFYFVKAYFNKERKRKEQKERLWNEYLEAKKSGDPARIADASSAIDQLK